MMFGDNRYHDNKKEGAIKMRHNVPNVWGGLLHFVCFDIENGTFRSLE